MCVCVCVVFLLFLDTDRDVEPSRASQMPLFFRHQPRYTWMNRKQLTLPEERGAAGEERMEEDHGIREEEEQESDLDHRSGLNPTPVPVEIILEESSDTR